MTALDTLKAGGTRRVAERCPAGHAQASKVSLQRCEQIGRQIAAAQRGVVVFAAHPHQAGTARAVPQHPGRQPGLRPVRMPGGLLGGRFRVVRQRSPPRPGGSTTISWTRTQPATSSGQEICASASDSSPSGSDSWAIGV